MLMICMRDGFTVGNITYKSGEIFKLNEVLEKEFGSLSDTQLSRRQKEIYGEVLFRRPSAEEILGSFDKKTRKIAGKYSINELEKNEARVIVGFLESDVAKEQSAIEALASKFGEDKVKKK